jgi:hypothetical protein
LNVKDAYKEKEMKENETAYRKKNIYIRGMPDGFIHASG